jgi:hypothetical protein
MLQAFPTTSPSPPPPSGENFSYFFQNVKRFWGDCSKNPNPLTHKSFKAKI